MHCESITALITHSEGKSLGMGEKRDSEEKGHLKMVSLGGRAAADERSEETLLRSLNIWARAPKSLLIVKLLIRLLFRL